MLLAVRVVAALAGVEIEQLARRIGVVDDASVGIFELQQAAAAASVAKRLPLLIGHFGQSLCAPKRHLLVDGLEKFGVNARTAAHRLFVARVRSADNLANIDLL